MSEMEASNLILTQDNCTDFFESSANSTKAVLFTKKMDTPGLWMRVAEHFKGQISFGEVRLAETAIMQRFGMTEELLPKVVAMRKDVHGQEQNLIYEGPNDFDKIAEFFQDVTQGGTALVELKRQVETLQREQRGLRLELAQEQENTKAARAEAARIKLSQVGQVDSVKKSVETELQQARTNETALREQLEGLTKELNEKIVGLEEEKKQLNTQINAHQEVQQQAVLHLNADNADPFFASTLTPLKAVLFTTKTEVPAMWIDLAKAQSMSCAFGVVKHVEGALLNRFALKIESLPRIYLFGGGSEVPIVYQGPVKLEAITAFIQDAVQGGTACVEMRKQLTAAQKENEILKQEVKEQRKVMEVLQVESSRNLKEQVSQMDSTIKSLKQQLKDACAGAAVEIQRVRHEADEKCRRAEELAAEVSHELVKERESTQAKIVDALNRREAIIAQERKLWSRARESEVMWEQELAAVEKASKRCEKVVLRAASAVHVTLVRSAREKERMQASLKEFISDVAPSQISPAPPPAGGAVADDSNSEGLMDTISNQYKMLKKKLNRDDGSMSDTSDDSGMLKKAMKFITKKPGENVVGDPSSIPTRVRAAPAPIDAKELQRMKKNQSRELVSLRGHSDITIGQLTREVEKTGEKHVFIWKNLRLRLLFDGAIKDRLIDDETGDLVYSYSRELEEDRIRKKEFRQSESHSESENSKPAQSVALSSATQGTSHPAIASGSIDDWATGTKAPVPQSSKARSGRSPDSVARGGPIGNPDRPSDRSINRDPRISDNRMPALVGGVLVMAAAKREQPAEEDEKSEAVADSSWSAPGNEYVVSSSTRPTAEIGRKQESTGNVGRDVKSKQFDDADLGAWGAARSSAAARNAGPAPSLWSDDEDLRAIEVPETGTYNTGSNPDMGRKQANGSPSKVSRPGSQDDIQVSTMSVNSEGLSAVLGLELSKIDDVQGDQISERTRALLLDQDEPTQQQSRSLWNRLF